MPVQNKLITASDSRAAPAFSRRRSVFLDIPFYAATASAQTPAAALTNAPDRRRNGWNGFDDVETLAIEGPAWSAAQFLEAWNEPALRQALMEFLALIERETSVTGASAHLMAIGHRR